MIQENKIQVGQILTFLMQRSLWSNWKQVYLSVKDRVNGHGSRDISESEIHSRYYSSYHRPATRMTKSTACIALKDHTKITQNHGHRRDHELDYIEVYISWPLQHPTAVHPSSQHQATSTTTMRYNSDNQTRPPLLLTLSHRYILSTARHCWATLLLRQGPPAPNSAPSLVPLALVDLLREAGRTDKVGKKRTNQRRCDTTSARRERSGQTDESARKGENTG